MRICGVDNNISFDARVKLKDAGKLFNCDVKGVSKLDTMFNESSAVKDLNSFSLFIKKSIIKNHLTNEGSVFQRFTISLCHKLLKYSRVLADKIFFLKNEKQINAINEEIKTILPESKAYIENIAKVGNSIEDKFISINETNNPLEDIAKSNESVIFVLNHPNYHKDKFVYFIINSILSKMYVNNGLQETCPRPKILVSKNMLKIICEKNGNIYKHLGLTSVDASIRKKDSRGNSGAMKPLMHEFVENKSNIFIFPEGNNSLNTEKPLRARLQKGVAEIIKTASLFKEKVKIVPIGIKYTEEKNNIGNVFVGEPLIFSKKGKKSFVIEQNDIKKNLDCEKPTQALLDNISEAMEKALNKADSL